MLSQYFVQFGVVIFPILLYHLWAFRKSFLDLPAKTPIMGLYGGLAAILDQLQPVSIFGMRENFQCVPIIMAILYGKRKAGLVTVLIFTFYEVLSGTPNAWIMVLASIVYTLIPFAICNRFEAFTRKERLVFAIKLTLLTLLVQLVTIVILFLYLYHGTASKILLHLIPFFAVAIVTQFILMTISIVLMENILEEGRVRSSLKDGKDRYKSLIAHNPLSICAFDLENRFTMANASYEQLTGYTSNELLGRSRFDLWFEGDLNQAHVISDAVLHGEVVKDKESVIRHKNGNKIHVKFTCVPIVVRGEIIGFYGMAFDITHSKAAEEMLRNSEKLSAIGQLAAGVAHEIRNPLTAIKGFVQLMPSAGVNNLERYSAIVKSELSRVEAIVSEMLILAKPQMMELKPICITNKVDEIIYLLTAQANMQNVKLVTDHQEPTVHVLGDENQLKQVFINIIKNAIEAMPDGGNLTINETKREDMLIISFKDEGSGIPKEFIDKIGQPFYTTKSKGTGLGFLVSKRIIENHGGEMYIESTCGLGTTISIALPLLSQDMSQGRIVSYEYETKTS